MITSSAAPQLLLDGKFTVLAASASFCEAFEVDCGGAPGELIFALGAGEWDIPQLRSLLSATATGGASVDAYEMDLRRDGEARRRRIDDP